MQIEFMGSKASNTREISRYRPSSRVAKEIDGGRLDPLRICANCEFRDPLNDRCAYNGVVEPGASCHFWTEES
jgi:hypothetical protein